MADVSKKTIAKAEKDLMSPKDTKEDMMLVLGPHMNWQEMLCPAPLSVCLLGQLVLVTLDKDVSLVSEHLTRNRFKHTSTEYPESLRTSILQVADEGWNAFNLANKNMDQIRLLALQIPKHVKNAAKGAERGAEFRLEYTMSDMMRDTIYVQASEANKLSYMVNNLAEMYVEVSEKHLMDQVASLGELLALGGENDKGAVTLKMSQLKRQAQDATVSIGLIVTQKQLEFDTKVQRRIERIQREMKAVLPPPPPEDPTIKQQEKQAIKEAEKFKAEHKVVDEDDWA